MQDWFDLCYVKADRLRIEPATCQWQVQRPTAAPPRNIRKIQVCHGGVRSFTQYIPSWLCGLQKPWWCRRWAVVGRMWRGRCGSETQVRSWSRDASTPSLGPPAMESDQCLDPRARLGPGWWPDRLDHGLLMLVVAAVMSHRSSLISALKNKITTANSFLYSAIIISSQTILTKGSIATGGRFFTAGKNQCDTGQGSLTGVFNDPVCTWDRSGDCQCFQMGRKKTQTLPLVWGTCTFI